MKHGLTMLAALAALGGSSPAQAAPLLPGPGAPGHDAALATKMTGFERQIHGIMTVPLGWGLEAYVSDANARTQIEGFIASNEATFEDYSGQHIYEVLDDYGEYGDLGMFGGVQAAGDAFRYATLRDEGADAAEVAAAREHLLAAMDGLHWYTQITGVPGVVARGLRRVVPQAGAPALPGAVPVTVDLFDPMGQPQPADKEPTWREDFSGELPELIWLDDSSKDQLIGYIFALGVVHETVSGDDTIPPELVQRLEDDARALAASLMEPRQIGEDTIDLVIVDADGRPTSFFDLAAEVLTPDIIRSTAVNPFNAVMALGGMRTLYQITGDEEIGRFYYEELIDDRGYLDLAEQTLSVIYFGDGTNHSNVNMAFTAIYGLLRYEPELELATQARSVLQMQLYSADPDRSARGLRQSFFDFMVAGFGTEGSQGIGTTALSDGLDTLTGLRDAPYWDDAVINCDMDELAAGVCTAVDGMTTITLANGEGWNGGVVAEDPLPIEIRPPSNFLWRSNPHDVNGGGGTRLNPGGGIHCAYWMGRRLEAVDDGLLNISADARGRPQAPDPDPTGTSTGEPPPGTTTDPSTSTSTTGDGGSSGGSTADEEGDVGDDGCGCRTRPPPVPVFVLLLGVPLLLRRRPMP